MSLDIEGSHGAGTWHPITRWDMEPSYGAGIPHPVTELGHSIQPRSWATTPGHRQSRDRLAGRKGPVESGAAAAVSEGLTPSHTDCINFSFQNSPLITDCTWSWSQPLPPKNTTEPTEPTLWLSSCLLSRHDLEDCSLPLKGHQDHYSLSWPVLDKVILVSTHHSWEAVRDSQTQTGLCFLQGAQEATTSAPTVLSLCGSDIPPPVS